MAKRYYLQFFSVCSFAIFSLLSINSYAQIQPIPNGTGILTQEQIIARKQHIIDSIWGADYNVEDHLTSAFSRDQSHADCGTAIPICQETYTESVSSTGPGSVNDLSGTCLLGGEHETMWYIFTAQNSGTFGFLIQTSHDYD